MIICFLIQKYKKYKGDCMEYLFIQTLMYLAIIMLGMTGFTILLAVLYGIMKGVMKRYENRI